MLYKSLSSTDNQSVLQVSATEECIIYTLKPKSVVKFLCNVIRGEEVKFIVHKKGRN